MPPSWTRSEEPPSIITRVPWTGFTTSWRRLVQEIRTEEELVDPAPDERGTQEELVGLVSEALVIE